MDDLFFMSNQIDSCAFGRREEEGEGEDGGIRRTERYTVERHISAVSLRVSL